MLLWVQLLGVSTCNMLRVYYLVHLELSGTHLVTELSIHQEGNLKHCMTEMFRRVVRLGSLCTCICRRKAHGIEVALTNYLDCDRLLVYSPLFAEYW